MTKRSFTNPVIGDRVTILESAENSAGGRSLLQIELAPGGGNSLHIHRSFSEKFTVVEGELMVCLSNDVTVLKRGESAVALPNVPHYFANRTSATVTFHVELSPSHLGFEQALAIAYGLAKDGKVNRKGVPTSLTDLAIIAEMSGSYPTGIFTLMMPLFKWIARRSKKTEQDLLRRYWFRETQTLQAVTIL